MVDNLKETDPSTRPRMPIPCQGTIRSRVGSDPQGSHSPYRCDRCGARFNANQDYEGGCGEPVRKDGLNLRIEIGPCTCPIYTHAVDF